jgi:hypothetical protein
VDNWLWLIYGPAQLIERTPATGFAIGVLAIAVQAIRSSVRGDRISREWLRYPLILCGLLWLLFSLYELQMIAVGLGLATTRFRIDLIVLTPILYGVSAFAIMSLVGIGGVRAPARVDDDSPADSRTEGDPKDEEKNLGRRD